MKVKRLSFWLAVVLVITAFSGCGKKEEVVSTVTDLPKGEISYPIETEQTLKYWVKLNGTVAQVAPTVNETVFAEWEYEKTGIKVEYIHPAQGQEGEKFNLMLMSSDMPDIIVWYWYSILGGPEKAIKDGYITRLNDLSDYTPNFNATLQANPEADKMVKTDEGSYYAFPTLKLDPELTVFAGPIVRKDWLDDLGMAIPETIDDWYNMLKAFKDEKKADAPFSYVGSSLLNDFGAFIGAYGIKQNFYLDDGKIKYGPVEEGYKEFIQTFRKWYDEGLIDKNLAAVDNNALDAKMLNGNSGATVGFNSSSLGKWLTAMQEKDPTYNLAAAPFPVLNAGEKPKFGQKDLTYNVSNSAAISGKSKNKELAARFLDYAFSTEGNLLYNFGMEGESYNMVNGEPVYTDLIMNNPEKLSISSALAKYTHAAYEGPYPSDVRYFRQYYPMAQQKEAIPIWANTDAEKHLLPRIMMTMEESEDFKTVMTDITTLVEEQSMKFIMGVEPLENLDKFIEEIKSMNIEKAIEIQQAALERYNVRK